MARDAFCGDANATAPAVPAPALPAPTGAHAAGRCAAQHLHLRLQHVAVRCGRTAPPGVAGSMSAVMSEPAAATKAPVCVAATARLPTALPRSSAYTLVNSAPAKDLCGVVHPGQHHHQRTGCCIGFVHAALAQVVADGEFAQLEQHSRHGSAHHTSCHCSGTEGMNLKIIANSTVVAPTAMRVFRACSVTSQAGHRPLAQPPRGRHPALMTRDDDEQKGQPQDQPERQHRARSTAHRPEGLARCGTCQMRSSALCNSANTVVAPPAAPRH